MALETAAAGFDDPVGSAALWEQMHDKTRITGAIIDPLGRDRNPDTTRIDGTLIGSQSLSRTAEG